MEHRSPAVQTLYTHLENEQIVVFPDAATEEERAAAIKDKHTDLMNYFARPLGRKFDNLTYIEYYEKYTVNEYGNVGKRRVKRNSSIARISFLAPTNGDVYYLRLLLLSTAARSFSELLEKEDGSAHEKYEDAARSLGLVETGEEYKLALREARFFLTGQQFRRLFVTLLMDGASGTELWEEFQGDLTEDYFS